MYQYFIKEDEAANALFKDHLRFVNSSSHHWDDKDELNIDINFFMEEKENNQINSIKDEDPVESGIYFQKNNQETPENIFDIKFGNSLDKQDDEFISTDDTSQKFLSTFVSSFRNMESFQSNPSSMTINCDSDSPNTNSMRMQKKLMVNIPENEERPAENQNVEKEDITELASSKKDESVGQVIIVKPSLITHFIRDSNNKHFIRDSNNSFVNEFLKKGSPLRDRIEEMYDDIRIRMGLPPDFEALKKVESYVIEKLFYKKEIKSKTEGGKSYKDHKITNESHISEYYHPQPEDSEEIKAIKEVLLKLCLEYFESKTFEKNLKTKSYLATDILLKSKRISKFLKPVPKKQVPKKQVPKKQVPKKQSKRIHKKIDR